MRITTKGQVTIPMPIREEFGFKPGTDVEFVADHGKVVLRARRKGIDPVEAWLQESAGIAYGRTTTAKVMKLTRGED
jgi:AbrB family looped-hinge helix DNA binding protein